jgi:uncharacterized protein (TIGR03067 family)
VKLTPLLALLFLVAAAVAAPVPKALKAKRPDAEVFVGTWELVNADGGPAKHVWTFDPDLTMWSKVVGNTGKGSEWKVKIDPEKTPKEIDFGTIYRGIYEIEADEIRIVYTSDKRPADFDDKARMTYTVIRRVK